MTGMTRERRSELVRNAAAICEESKFGKILPNALTLLGLCCGATAIRFALSADWKAAVIATSEIVQVGIGPLADRGRQLEYTAALVRAVTPRCTVEIAGTVECQGSPGAGAGYAEEAGE